MGYPLVKISNSTNYVVDGKVSYSNAFCSDDDYIVVGGTTWQAKSSGVCLLTKITAIVNVSGTSIEADSYTSSGTSYSQFAIIDLGNNHFAVTRIVN